MKPTARLHAWSVALLLATPGLAQEERTDAPAVEPSLLEGLEYRMIGPSRGGRVTAVAGVVGEPFTFYMGSTGGGVWKTGNAGMSWDNVTDGHLGVGSIGAVAVAPSDPNVVYVGTGSACPRGNVSVGDGVYRSTDGGGTWTHVGLGDAGQVGRIRVHPSDPDVVYVAALGHIFGPNEERGVYRSTDGGSTWERVLHVSERTGCVDLAIDVTNPRVLFAAMWTAERKPWTLIDGSDEGGLYKTADGGDTWTRLEKGLPTGVLGRIGVAVSPANPARVWAVVVAEKGRDGLFRSDDGGESFERVCEDRRLLSRGWYYAHVFADPTDENTVYAMGVPFLRSVDGGKTFESIATPHSDHHDLWISPADPKVMVLGNDGGATVTLDGGGHWSTLLNQPTAEIYRVTVDDRFPYRVYGAQQDNSTIGLPSRPTRRAITAMEEWFDVAGGESGHIAVHPTEPDLTYAGNYIGTIERYDRRTGHARNVIVYPQLADGVAPKDLRYRFQWNAPISFSPHDPDVVYHCSNHVHRSRDAGLSWETISPDLTTDDETTQLLPGGPVQHDHTGVEVFHTIFSFAESPHRAGELWAGSDDGLVHLSRDDGASWVDVTPRDMPHEGTVNTLEISPHRAGRVFLAVQRYRMDDVRPTIFRTDDHGGTWTLLTADNGIPADHPVRVVREDPDREGLLYAGTEHGLFVSFDDGVRWQSFRQNLPVVPVTDLAVKARDLVVATQGRSIWVLDDLSPLHQLDVESDPPDVALFEPRDAYLTPGGSYEYGFVPADAPVGATLSIWFAAAPPEGVTLEIVDDGDVIRTLHGKVEGEEEDEEEVADDKRERFDVAPGMTRVQWDLLDAAPDLLDDAVMSLGYTGGAPVVPGRYTVRLTVPATDGGDPLVIERPLTVRNDPRHVGVTTDDLVANRALSDAIRGRLLASHDAIRTLRSIRDQMDDLRSRLEAASSEVDITADVEAISDKLAAIEGELIQTDNESSDDPLNFPPKLDNQLAYLYGDVAFALGRPTRGARERFDDLSRELDVHLAALRAILEVDVAALNRRVADAGVPAILVPDHDRGGRR